MRAHRIVLVATLILCGNFTASGQDDSQSINPVARAQQQRLIEAAFHLDVKAVKKLIDAGVDVDARYGEGPDGFADPWSRGAPMCSDEWTALIAVASSDLYPPPPAEFKGWQDLGRIHEEQEKIPVRQIEQRRKRQIAIAEALVQAGADLDLADSRGTTALAAATAQSDRNAHYVHIAMLLVKKGAKVNTKTGIYIDGPAAITPLHHATRHPELIKAMLEAGADVNARTSRGGTALHWAVLGSNSKSVELLLAGGADPAIKDKTGRRPIDWVFRTFVEDTPEVQKILDRMEPEDRQRALDQRTIHRLLLAAEDNAKADEESTADNPQDD